ncbi:MAG: hypothetical protein ACRD6W_19490, partial [Nitrososphaerales archaeon]
CEAMRVSNEKERADIGKTLGDPQLAVVADANLSRKMRTEPEVPGPELDVGRMSLQDEAMPPQEPGPAAQADVEHGVESPAAEAVPASPDGQGFDNPRVSSSSSRSRRPSSE